MVAISQNKDNQDSQENQESSAKKRILDGVLDLASKLIFSSPDDEKRLIVSRMINDGAGKVSKVLAASYLVNFSRVPITFSMKDVLDLTYELTSGLHNKVIEDWLNNMWKNINGVE